MEQREIEERLKAMVNGPHQFSAYNNIFLEKVQTGRTEGRLFVTENSLNPHVWSMAAPW